MADEGIREIDPDGDVILVCGSGEEIQKLCVNSTFLGRTSKVFRAMLSRHFSEGAKLAATSAAIEIPLPDDGPEAMTLICHVLHFRHNSVPATLNTDELLNVGILADKYAFTEAMKPTARWWLDTYKKVMEDSTPDVLRFLVAVGLYFEDDVLCRDAAHRLLLITKGEITIPDGDHVPAVERVFGLCLIPSPAEI